MLNTAFGCKFMDEEQVSYTRDGWGHGGRGSNGGMVKHCEKMVTWLKIK